MKIYNKDKKYINNYINCLEKMLNVNVDQVLYNDSDGLDNKYSNSNNFNVLDLKNNYCKTMVGLVTFIAYEMRCFYQKQAINNSNNTKYTLEEINKLKKEYEDQNSFSIYNRFDIDSFSQFDAYSFARYITLACFELITHDFPSEHEDQINDYIIKKIEPNYINDLTNAVNSSEINIKNTRIWILRNS